MTLFVPVYLHQRLVIDLLATLTCSQIMKSAGYFMPVFLPFCQVLSFQNSLSQRCYKGVVVIEYCTFLHVGDCQVARYV